MEAKETGSKKNVNNKDLISPGAARITSPERSRS